MNELNEASLGGALLSQLGAKLRGSGEGQLTLKDRMRQQQFISDFIGRVTLNLNQGIQSGLINPDPKAQSPAPQGGGKGGEQPAPAPSPVPGPNPAPKPGPQPAPGPAPKPGPQPAPGPAPKPGPQPSPQPGGAKQPAGKTPDELARIRKEKQKVAGAEIQKQMAANPAPAKPTAQPAAPAATPQVPALDPRAAGAKSRQRLQTRSFNRATKESKYNQLDAILESVINLNEEGQYAYTISSYLQNFLKQYMKGMDTSALKPMADAVQASYAQDKGKSTLPKLASAAFSLYWTGGGADGAAAGAGAPKSVGDALAAGLKQGLTGKADAEAGAEAGAGETPPADGTKQAPTGDTAKNPAGDTSTPGGPVSPKQAGSAYQQAKELVGKLNKQQKRYVLNTLKKELGMPVDTKAAPDAGATGGSGATTTGVSGVGDGTVRHKASRATKVKQTNASKKKATAPKTTKPATSKAKKASPFPVAENKTYKVWGSK